MSKFHSVSSQPEDSTEKRHSCLSALLPPRRPLIKASEAHPVFQESFRAKQALDYDYREDTK